MSEMLFVSNKLANHTFHIIYCILMTSYGCHGNGKCSFVSPFCRFGCHQCTLKISF